MKNQTGSVLIPIIIALMLIVGAGVAAISTGVVSNPISQQPTVSSVPTFNPTQQPLQIIELSLDQISVQNVSQSPLLKQVENLDDGSIRYRLKSPLEVRDDLVIFKDNQVIFKRSVKLAADQVLPALSDYLTKYGSATQILTGSAFYGEQKKLYIFASVGKAVIANSNTNEVYEEQSFKPTTVEEYLKQFGNDYAPPASTGIQEPF